MLAIRGILSYETINTLVIPLVAQRLSRRNNLLPTDPRGQLRVHVLEPIVFFPPVRASGGTEFALATNVSDATRTLLALCTTTSHSLAQSHSKHPSQKDVNLTLSR
jgi:hypothetical protein